MIRRGVLPLLAAIALAGCGGEGDGTPAAQAPPPAATATTPSPQTSARTVVDVRTPEEYASGHAPGAVNIDVQAPEFRAQVEELDAGESYLVYCRSGNRSAQAAAVMREVGLDVEDGGGLDDMAAAGWSLDER
jgi:phage shock protein E